MATKFFNNTPENTLFEKFKGIANGMANFHSFLAVVGYFRSSGYFKLRKELTNVQDIKILVGINIDSIFRKHNQALLMLEGEDEAKKIYSEDFVQDVRDAQYSTDVEEGILQLCDDIVSGKLQMRIHKSKNLHAKFYLCLPETHTEHTDGWVIMGSSNISDSGLGITQSPRYELNVAMKDFDDVDYCHTEFKRLWEEGVPITADDIENMRKKTHLDSMPSPYEIYMKVLIDTFGTQVEDDFSLELPNGVRDLKYQKDAVIQGYQMLLKHNGFFLADVVGLGKTNVATMIAKRFMEANGRHTHILVIFPPALKRNWIETFKLFGIQRGKNADFVTNGSLKKVIDADGYRPLEEYDLIIVDEAHRFRSGITDGYDDLQRICKSRRTDDMGLIKGRKRVMLLSATPLNNRPEDLQNQILLFQDAAHCTIEGVANINNFFGPYNTQYKRLMSNRNIGVNTEDVDKIYAEIRERLLDKITIRRTRTNIWNDPNYRKDLLEQNIVFPNILPPTDFTYQMDTKLCSLFYQTLDLLTDMPSAANPNGSGLYYARYRAIEYIIDSKKIKKTTEQARQMALTLAGIYRVHMVKRLESSFYAFYRSLETLRKITDDMIRMFDNNTIIIAPELNVKDLFRKFENDGDVEFDEVIEKILAKAAEKGLNADEIVYTADDFSPEYLETLKSDLQKITDIQKQWKQIEAKGIDPKLDLFLEKMETEFFDKKHNPTGKLVIFSESVDTVNYLNAAIANRLKRNDVLSVSSKNRGNLEQKIHECFDANFSADKQSDDYNIIITSDVLSEGINLHRSNVIVNYDTPWNSTRLMQRIGRVNRIGSVAECIYNYMFYPSNEGDKQIQLYRNALIKLQGFHSALGEDAQIFSQEEIVKTFELFDPKVKDKVDKQLELLREVRALYQTDRKLYSHIKQLPLKSRTIRSVEHRTENSNAESIAFIKSPIKVEFYTIVGNKTQQVDFLDAIDVFRALPSEKPLPLNLVAEQHYQQVRQAINRFNTEMVQQTDTNSLTISTDSNDKRTKTAQKFLRIFISVTQDQEMKDICNSLLNLVADGQYNQLNLSLQKLAKQYKNDKLKIEGDEYNIEQQIRQLHQKYETSESTNKQLEMEEPLIVLSETFANNQSSI